MDFFTKFGRRACQGLGNREPFEVAHGALQTDENPTFFDLDGKGVSGAVRDRDAFPRGRLESPIVFRADQEAVFDASFPQVAGHMRTKVGQCEDAPVHVAERDFRPVGLFEANLARGNFV